MTFRVIALLAAVLAAPAFATTTASVSAGSFDTVLKDLNPSDGVTAALTWDTGWTLAGGAGYAPQTGYQLVSYSWGNSLEAQFGTYVSAYDSTGSPTTVLANSVAGGGYSVSLDGGGRPSASVQLSIDEGTTAYASAQFSRGFWLTAGTQVSFSVLADRQVTGTAYTGSWTAPAGVNSYSTHSWAYSQMGLSIGALNSSNALSGSNQFAYDPQAYDSTGEADQLKLTLKNTSVASQYYVLNFYAQVNLQDLRDPALATAVPEPATYTLMGLGLLAIGTVARRRRA